MDKGLEIKLKGMFWDLPLSKRDLVIKQIIRDPQEAFREKEMLIRGLNTLNWYELLQVLGPEKLSLLLTDDIISCLFPKQRQLFYRNAKKLLSKYSVPSAG